MAALLVVMAHPDDESMGTGGLIARHSSAGVEVHLICATRGEAGWAGKPPGAKREDLGEIRTAELRAAAAELGLREFLLWHYPDGGVESSDQTEITERIAHEIRRLRPSAVVGWGPDGVYGHPDHVALGRCTDAAVKAVAEPERPELYHLAVDAQAAQSYRDILRLVGADAGGLELVVVAGANMALDLTPAEVQTKLRAIDCHESQLEDWRVQIRHHPELLQRGYGHEVYKAVSAPASRLTRAGLLPEYG